MTYATVFAGYEERREYLREWVDRHYIEALGLEPGTMLDAGCGDGFWADLFSARGFDVTGFDVDEMYVAAGREKYPHLTLEVADAGRPLPFGLFDVVFCRAISHLYQPSLDGACEVIENLGRHLAINARLVLTAYTDGSGEDRPGASGGVLRHHVPGDYEVMIANADLTICHRSIVGNYHIWAAQASW